MGCSISKREVYGSTSLLQEIRKISNEQPNLPPNRIRKRRKTATTKNLKLVEGRKS